MREINADEIFRNETIVTSQPNSVENVQFSSVELNCIFDNCQNVSKMFILKSNQSITYCELRINIKSNIQ